MDPMAMICPEAAAASSIASAVVSFAQKHPTYHGRQRRPKATLELRRERRNSDLDYYFSDIPF